MFIEEVIASYNCYMSQWICMHAYSIYQDYMDLKIPLTTKGAAEVSYLCDIYAEESEKWYNTLVSIVNRRKRVKRQKKFFLEKLSEIVRDVYTIRKIERDNREELTKW